MKDKRSTLHEIKSLIAGGREQDAFQALCRIASPDDDFTLQSRYGRLWAEIRAKQTGFRSVRLAILGTSTLDHFASILAFWLAHGGIDAEIFLAKYDTVHQTILDPDSALYAFRPDIVWLFLNHRDLQFSVTGPCTADAVQSAARQIIQQRQSLWDALAQRSKATIIENNADLPAERVFGNYEGTIPWGRIGVLRCYNLLLTEAVSPGVVLFDLDYLSSLYGKARWVDQRYWHHSKHAFAFDATGLVAFSASRLVGAVNGLAKKCLVVDLDNTLWGGVVGDDGLSGIRLGQGADGEAFVAFQRYLRQLKERGVLIAVCSKNDEATALEPFRHHPDMQLREDDIAVFVANWENKADNVRDIAARLNIGLDSIVFVDDNPAERELIRSVLPAVTVCDLPDDPAGYVQALDGLRSFETVFFSDEDSMRSRLYRDNADRQTFQHRCADLSSYLRQLDMRGSVGVCDDIHRSRMAQLINKSNQFHLTGTRYTEAQLDALRRDPRHHLRYFTLADRFGDNGVIAVVILRNEDDGALTIDTWVMSCRVLSRGMEEFICQEIQAIAGALRCSAIRGCYTPSKKNQLVAGLYGRLGFTCLTQKPDGTTCWELRLDGAAPQYECFIVRDPSSPASMPTAGPGDDH